MANSNKCTEQWKAEGDRLCREKRFYQAIGCYDMALRRTIREDSALVLLLNRCHARVSSQHFDSALEDAKAVLERLPGNEKALFRAAKALYGLRRYKESADQLSKVVNLFPQNREANRDFGRCLDRLREERGGFDFAAMLDEAISKSPKPDMDRADYTGPIEVRDCALKSHGRGVFSTRPIKAGELLLVEKSFCSTFANDSSSTGKRDETTGLWGDKCVSELRADIATTIFVKLHRNPSLVPAFADLFPGPEAIEELDEIGNPIVDDAFVQHRIMYNAFAFSILSRNWHWRATRATSALNGEMENKSSSIGVWLKASYINHSCYPTVRRSFIGDMMVWRAQADIAPNTEVKFGYISGAQDFEGRQEALSKYGFNCECQICLSEKATPLTKIKDRDTVMLEVIKCFERPIPTDIEIYFAHLRELQSTYISPPSQEPRRSLILPIMNLLEVCKSEHMLVSLIKLSITLLHGLGFELDVTPSSWRIKTWGYMCDDAVPLLADLWHACGSMQPKLCEGLERDLKTAYTIMAGEVESFEGMYGSARPENLNERLREMETTGYQEMATLHGLETVDAMVGNVTLGERNDRLTG